MKASNGFSPEAESPDYEYCDVVMKGGITSGVIYPKAAVELAKRYRFKNVGGTSAGAIAAAVVAAAEYGRRGNNPTGFDTVAALPDNLAKDGHLLALFTPDAATRGVFRIALGLIGPQSKGAKIVKTFLGIMVASPFASFSAFLIGFILGFGPCMLTHLQAGERWWALSPLQWLLSSVSTLLLAALLGLIAASVLGFLKTARALADNGFGMCSGMASAGGSSDSLTGWIHLQIQTAAGRSQSEPALTFGDLWNAPAYPGETLKTDHTIHLQTVTTNLTQGRPFSMPFEQKIWFFDPDEMRRLLPEEVVSQMIAAATSANSFSETVPLAVSSPLNEKVILVKLPPSEALPILLATRMSLSFPALLSAVPLYVVDHTLERNQAKTQGDLDALGVQSLVGTKMWFSDGGICSNFPINFFDSPVPRWPTFGITLQMTSASPQDQDANLVEMTQPNRLSQLTWNNLGDRVWRPDGLTESHDAIDCVARFGKAILDTMQNWRDNLQTAAPGFRERVVTVKLRPDEGGLNLNMSQDLIDKLGNRGAIAGQRLATEFRFPAHMFIRFRTMLSALQEYLRQLTRSLSDPIPAEDNQGMAYIRGEKKPSYYDWPTEELRQRAIEAAKELITLAERLEPMPPSQYDFSYKAPRPLSHLHNTPDF